MIIDDVKLFTPKSSSNDQSFDGGIVINNIDLSTKKVTMIKQKTPKRKGFDYIPSGRLSQVQKSNSPLMPIKKKTEKDVIIEKQEKQIQKLQTTLK